jgi:ABC-2 type transport system permease protein
MRNFYFIAFYDWLMLRANKMLLSCFALLALFVAFALWTGQQRVAFHRATLVKVKATEKRLFAEKRQLVADLEQSGQAFTGNSHRNPTEPNGAANSAANRYFSLAPAPLAVVAVGQSDLRAYYYKFGLHKKQALYHGEEIENASILYNGHFDLAFVITFLLPLLIIALTFNVVASEKERGTLPLILAGTTPLRSVALNKFVFRFGVLSIFFSGLVLSGLALVGVSIGQEAAGIAALLGVTTAYAAFWFGISFGVNSQGRGSGFNAAVLVGLWLALLVVLPALLSVASNAFYPMPSRVELIAETREASEEAKKNGAQILAQYFEDHPELAAQGSTPVDTKNFAVSSLMVNLEVEKAIRPLEEKFEEQKDKQARLVAQWRFLSPAIFVQQMLENIAATGDAHYLDFEQQMQNAHPKYRAFFTQKIIKQEKMRAADYDLVPRSQYSSSPGLIRAARAGFWDILWLFGAGALAVIWGLLQVAPQKMAEPRWIEA